MTTLPFSRLFSMPAFEGLRILRVHVARRPEEQLCRLVEIVRSTEPYVASYDLDAAVFLHDLVPKDAPHTEVIFYRVCLGAVLLIELPEWAKLMTLGRGRFIKRLGSEEFRDVRSLFRQARLLDEPPSADDVDWWDDIQAHVRLQHDAEKMRRGRAAEQLSIAHERERLAKLGLSLEPRWMAIEDNTVGYDVLSYNSGKFGPLNKLIEVKSTIASPLRFFLTRNEWDQAKKFGPAYVFHVWDMQKEPAVLYEKTVEQIAHHVPQDSKKGQWKTALIPVGV
ncbi:hypothetical protein C3O69_02469 [Pseudomonas aeruginosa]|nr:hypothetical protein C3O69_02469 [Pseudomonas aeruginosa]RUI37338.1 DUF3883 domain-containing protein [Pseudomonas aeruginosa]